MIPPRRTLDMFLFCHRGSDLCIDECAALPAPFGSLVAEDVVHEAPQSRERVRGRAADVRFNAEGFPWRLAAEGIGGTDREAVSLIQFSCNLHAVMSGGVAAAGDHLGSLAEWLLPCTA
jgi:hypothetical protein